MYLFRLVPSHALPSPSCMHASQYSSLLLRGVIRGCLRCCSANEEAYLLSREYPCMLLFCSDDKFYMMAAERINNESPKTIVEVAE
jgi:hypothetical protein